MEKLKTELVRTLENVGDAFESDELAYLALTTKIETSIRDKWAYLLHKKLYSDGFIIAREWCKPQPAGRSRADLAILRENHLVASIELTAMYSFDGLRKGSLQEFKKKLDKDAKKNDERSNSFTTCYRVLLLTHPKQKIQSNFLGIVKYADDINAAIKKYGEIKNRSIESIEKMLTGLNYKLITINKGKAFEIETEVLCWLIED